MEVNSLITAMESDYFHTALPLLENIKSDQLSELTLPDILKYLIEKKRADPFPISSSIDTWELPPVLSRGNDVVLHLLKKHSYNISLYKRAQLLFYTCLVGHMDIVTYLITEADYDPHCTRFLGLSCLGAACWGGHLDVVKYLVEMHHFNSVKDRSLQRAAANDTPLHYAALNGHLEVVRFFIEDMKCDPNCNGQYERTPLYLASGGGHLDVVKYLVDTYHCDPLCPDKNMSSSLHRAAIYGQLEVVQYFATIKYCNLELIKDEYNDTPVHDASHNGHLEVVRFFLEDMKCDPNCKSQYKGTPLHHASARGHLDVVKYLVDTHHCDPLCPDENKCTPLHRASISGQLEIVKYLATIKYFKDLERIKDKCNDTPLHCASLTGHLKVVKFYTEEMNHDPNCKGHCERTPLHHASGGGHLDVVKYLVDTYHCDPLCPDKNMSSSLHRAAIYGQLEVVQFFATIKYCNLELIKDKCNDTPVHDASQNGHLEVVRFFLEDMKCDPNCKGRNEGAPLHHASARGHLDVVKYLVDTHHCDPLRPDEDKCTPWHRAAYYGQLEVVQYFATIKYCNLELIKDKCNDTPVHLASHNGHLDVVRFFTDDIKCDPNCKGRDERTPLHHASEGGHLDVVKYLVNTHCDPLSPDNDNMTPLHTAVINGQSKVAEYLVSTLDCITPLHLTALCNNLKVVKFFIAVLNYDPKSNNQLGRTPLHHASEGGHLDVVKYLVYTHHCDPLCLDENNETPLHTAALKGESKVVKFLTSTLQCITPLHLKVVHSNLEVVKILIEGMKYNPYCRNNQGRTPLHFASEGGHISVVKYLVDTHHCDPLHPDINKTTPLHLAAANDQLEIVKYFANIPDCNLQVKNAKKFSPFDIASQCGHYQVESFLLRATTTKPVLQRDIISPSLNIFVIGNSGSGKSTLVKALSDENSLFGRFITVKGVTPLTAGIVPTTINSRVFGSVNIYDFAGHEEYHVSHEILLQQNTHRLVLLTVDLFLPLQTIEKQLEYWLSMLSNFPTCHVVVIGSHVDLAKGINFEAISQKIVSLISSESSIRYHGPPIQCDCRYPNSFGLNQLRQQLKPICRLIQVILASCESNKSNRLCASLMNILKDNFPERAIITVSEVMKHIKEPGSEELLDESWLAQKCKLLSSNGHLIFLCHEIIEKSLLVLNERVILQEVHACLGNIEAYLPNEFGIIEENKLREILSKSLKNVMEPEQAIKYLIFTQFCTKVASDQLISPPDGEKIVTYYFFPNLALASRPGDLLPSGDLKYTHLYTWCLKCSKDRQFFTHRYLHTLFIQLIKCEKNVQIKLEYKIWNKGILIVHNSGTRSIIEVTDQKTRVSLAIQCVEGCESFLVKHRSLLISLIKSMAHKICPRVEVEEFFILPQNTFPPENPQQVPIARIAHSVIDSLVTVSYNDGDILRHSVVKYLLYFDSLLVIKGLVLRTIFTQYQSNNAVPLVIVTRIHNAVETCRELQEWFEDEAGQCRRDMTYRQLYRELIKYSIFTDGNLYVSCWSF